MIIPLLSTAVAFLVFLILIIRRVARSGPDHGGHPNSRLPGPPRLPVIGNLHQFALGGGLPHVVLRDLASTYGPDLMQVKLGELELVVASSSRAAREILKTHDLNFANRPAFTASTIVSYGNKDIAFAPYGAYWRQLRKICTLELLSSPRVRDSFEARKGQVQALVDDLKSRAAGSTVNLSDELLLLSTATMCRIAFGAKCRQGKRFIRAANKMLDLSSGFNLADLFPSGGIVDALTGASSKVKRFHKEMDETLGEIIDDHRARRDAIAAGGGGGGEGEEEEEAEDLVDVLLSLQEKGGLGFPLELTHIKAVITDMFLGGTETGSKAMEWTMAELMRHPELMKRVQSEIRQSLNSKPRIENEDLGKLHNMGLVIKEALRLHAPFSFLLPRTCVSPCTVMGYDFPAGSKVIINSWAIGRDPQFWGDGDGFRPERFEGRPVDFAGDSFDFLPFGGGRRICPGQGLGVASMELVLALLLYHFDWELPGGMKPEDLDMAEKLGATIGRKSDLCLLAKPHGSSVACPG